MSSQAPAAGSYVLIRNEAEIDRLNTQFNAWQTNIKYLLHPDIPVHDHMRLADVGTGTGIWLRQLSEVLPKTCTLDGFDLSRAQFPDEKDLAPNINFYIQDLREPFPQEFLGQYDAVNIRLMAVALSAHEFEPAVRNLMTLLKPGGYLQWADCAAHRCAVEPSEKRHEAIEAEKLLQWFRDAVSTLGKTADGLDQLFSTYQKCGLRDCKEEIYKLEDPKSRANVTSTVLQGCLHILTAALALGKFDWLTSVDQVVQQKETAAKELEALGCWYCYDAHVIIGQKP